MSNPQVIPTGFRIPWRCQREVFMTEIGESKVTLFPCGTRKVMVSCSGPECWKESLLLIWVLECLEDLEEKCKA